jgi:3-hydroxypropanoate dehydrogenase
VFNEVMTTDLDLTAPGRDLDEVATIPDEVADVLFRSARSVREFADRPVEDATLQAAWDLAKWGPTAINTVPLRLLVVRGEQARARLAAHMSPGNRDRVLTAPVSVVVAADQEFHRHLPVLAPHLPGKAEELEALPAARTGMARTNALLQTGYLIVALRAVGLAVGPMGGMDAAAIDADLLAGTGWSSLLVLNLGYAQGDGGTFPRAPRLGWTAGTRTI